jgi:hypothetical protein
VEEVHSRVARETGEVDGDGETSERVFGALELMS